MKARGTPPESRGLDEEIDRLYQLPLAEFTGARNELAKRSGKRSAEIKALAKPPVAAWAVNQLYWHRRSDYDALVGAAQQLRSAHAAVLGGKTGDVRGAGKAHEERVTAALDAVLEILNEAGHAAGDTMRQPILTTLRALPADTPGRLTRTLQPGGFEALAGLSIRGVTVPHPAAAKPAAKTASAAPPHAGKRSARDTKALTKAREAVAAATRALKHAEHTAQREEFERARTARDTDQAARAAAKAREALEEAEAAVRAAEAAEAAAQRKKEAAERRAQQAEDAVDASRSRLEAAQKELDGIKE
jgi:hypothetical protein